MLSTFLRFTGSQSSSPSTRRYGYTQLPLTPTSSPTQTRFPELEEQRSDDGDDVEDDPLLRARAPLPYLQLLILCLMRLAEPIAFTTIFPFANDQVASVLPDVPRSDIGYWTGAVESCFAVIQACVVLLWGRTSDRIGRKPVLLIGLAGVSISMCSFGMSKTYTGLILSRAIAGLCNGNIGVLKATVAEIMDGTEGKFSASAQARVFALIPFCYAMGSIIGPFIGASLSDPLGVLDQDSHIPKDDPRFLAQYPFFLRESPRSCLLLASMLLLMIMMVGSLCDCQCAEHAFDTSRCLLFERDVAKPESSRPVRQASDARRPSANRRGRRDVSATVDSLPADETDRRNHELSGEKCSS